MFLILVIISILYVWLINFNKPKCDKIYIEDLFKSGILKTGDMILFKALNNMNSVKMCNYFTHVGMIVIDPILTNGEVHIFEATGISSEKKNMYNGKNRIYLTPLKKRLKEYLGYIYYRPLSHNITDYMHLRFVNFIFYAFKNMYYNYNIIGNIMSKKIGLSKCNDGTNCGELIYLSLINMGLINEKTWHKPLWHYLKWLSNLKKLSLDYYYKDPIEILVNDLPEN